VTAAVPTVRIIGTHGVPAAYGGFETAAQHVGLYLRDRGWRVVVYCQANGEHEWRSDTWEGLERVHVPEHRPDWRGTSSFDLKCVRHLIRERGELDVCLTFGYNTGALNIAQRVRRVPNVINMDGMEWTRRRWGVVKQAILLGGERFAGWVGDVLIADHPEIAKYLRRHFGKKRVVTITYGAHAVDDAPTAPLEALGLTAGNFATMICRPIPENSIEEIVAAWSQRPRGIPLVVLGDFLDDDPYHRRVKAAAGDEIVFAGAIYDPAIVGSLRFHSRLYMHGHTVGGTNPSLVEAMAASNAVVAHDNKYNTWVAGEGARYFDDTASLAALLDRLVDDRDTLQQMQRRSRERFEAEFTWDHIGSQYEAALLTAMARRGVNATSPSEEVSR
jgi:glycosyltransferase involved in cell wall biosynthesis